MLFPLAVRSLCHIRGRHSGGAGTLGSGDVVTSHVTRQGDILFH